MTAKALKEMEHEKPDDTDFHAIVLRLVKRLESVYIRDLAVRTRHIWKHTSEAGASTRIRELLVQEDSPIQATGVMISLKR